MKTWDSPYLGQLNLDDLAKLVPLIFVCIYVCGYLVLSIHFSQYGIIQGNPFRPRILAAGILLIALTAFPVMGGNIAHAVPARGLSMARATSVRLCATPIVCQLISLPTWLLIASPVRFFAHDGSPPLHNTLEWHFLWVGILSGMFILPALALRLYVTHWKLATLLFFVSSICVTTEVCLLPRSFALFLWYLGIAILTLFYRTARDIAARSLRQETDSAETNDRSALQIFERPLRLHAFASCFLLALTLASLFSLFVYKTLPTAVGGGQPISVYLIMRSDVNGDSKTIPESGPYHLLDESNQGMYVHRTTDQSTVFFIPRDRISTMIYLR
jgi:hypothetical protein